VLRLDINDPLLGRFISADTVVPGSGPLTVASLDAVERSAWASGGSEPVNPQDLNRYSYTLNNPLNATDPTEHWTFGISIDGSYDVMGTTFGGSLGLNFDGEGNVSLTISVASGASSSSVGGYMGASLQLSLNNPNIDALEGLSTVVGASGGGGLIAGGDIAFAKDTNTGGQYQTGSVSGGIGFKPTLPAIPGEFHLKEAMTASLIKGNPVNAVKKWSKNGEMM